jgi:catechol 2,3-dioxygenase-like lactoylglutathione lyase family enzyme
MKPRITVITLGVHDLERSLRFYRDGLKLAIWPRQSLAHDSGLPVGKPSATELTLGHNVSSKKEVDDIMGQAKEAGAAIVKPAQDTFWGGYAGYFQDPDGHLWEVVWNPELLPAD